MLLIILLLIKFGIFMYLTEVVHNRLLIFTVSTLITLFFFSLIYLSNNSKRKQTLAFTFYNIVSAFMFADVLYYNFFDSLPTFRLITQINQIGAAGDSVKSLLNPLTIFLLADIPFLCFYSSKKKEEIRKEKKKYNKKTQIGVPTAILVTVIIIFTVFNSYGYGTAIERQELYTYHFLDFVNLFRSEKIVAEENIDKDLPLRGNNIEGERKHYGIGKGRNLIVIQIESFQNFLINHNYNGQEITPNLNKLIKDKSSIYFDNYFQQLGRGNTSDAEFVSQNSLYPTSKDGSYFLYEDNTFYGLPWILRDEGYTSWVFHGYEPDFWNRERAYPNQGFERFISEDDYDIKEAIGFGLVDKEFFKQSIPYIKEMEEPFYSFMITLTSHIPFEMPEKYQVLEIREEHKDTMFSHYLQSVHYTDEAIGEFIEELKEEGLYENSVIALYGDHHGLSPTIEDNKEVMSNYLGYEYDYQDMMNIPLIIHVPGEDINETISTVGGQLDFLPTILNIMGIENEKGLMFGIDLLNSTDSLVAQQGHMLKGSFFDNEKQFTMSKDGIFENSRAHDLKTREPVDINVCRETYEKAIKEIELSDYILKNDLIKDLVYGLGEIKIKKDKEELNIKNMDYIAILKDNTVEELNEAYEKGFRLMEVQLNWNKYKRIVEIKGGSMTIKDLVNWLEAHEDAYITTTTIGNEIKTLVYLRDNYPELKDRIIPQIHNMTSYPAAFTRNFDYILLNPVYKEYTEEEIIDFVKRNEVLGVIISEDMIEEGLPKKLKEENLLTYVYSINDRKNIKELKRKDVFGIFTESLYP